MADEIELDDEDEAILDGVWDRIGGEEKRAKTGRRAKIDEGRPIEVYSADDDGANSLARSIAASLKDAPIVFTDESTREP